MPTDLFLLYFANFLSSLQYYLLVTLIPLYFSEEIGMTDLEAGMLFGGLGVVIGVLSVSFGSYF